MLLNKIDLLPHERFDSERCTDFARQVNPDIRVFQVSAETGEGLPDWYTWQRGKLHRKPAGPPLAVAGGTR